ncbi:hypothetical protein [Paenibacillus wulumuqiensis]|uniref:hypothetical protein n=1 Tax=Paenibacillus wulumuqiensis TaxID=1567107 RepID=UPI0012DEDA19|nr:hypothetical protein [Paenibacillus wulumuqiensis]
MRTILYANMSGLAFTGQSFFVLEFRLEFVLEIMLEMGKRDAGNNHSVFRG